MVIEALGVYHTRADADSPGGLLPIMASRHLPEVYYDVIHVHVSTTSMMLRHYIMDVLCMYRYEDLWRLRCIPDHVYSVSCTSGLYALNLISHMYRVHIQSEDTYYVHCIKHLFSCCACSFPRWRCLMLIQLTYIFV